MIFNKHLQKIDKNLIDSLFELILKNIWQLLLERGLRIL